MNRCRYRVPISEAECGCEHPDILHGGTIPLEVCNGCLLRAEPDYLSDNSRLYTLQQSQGVYVPRPRSCGGCGTVKRRVDAMQFVWPYWHAGASGDELRWSIRSVEQHFEGQAKITVVGDRPPWWHGHVIPRPRIGPAPNRGFRDMLSKMWTIATHAEIDPEFVWMMDDIYFTKPVALDELQQPRAYGWREDASNSWQRRKSNTMRVLRDAGATNYDYATHLPHWAEKTKLRDLFDRFDLANNTLLWEVLYGNLHRSRPIRPEPFFCRITATAGTRARNVYAGRLLDSVETAVCCGVVWLLTIGAFVPAPIFGHGDDVQNLVLIAALHLTIHNKPSKCTMMAQAGITGIVSHCGCSDDFKKYGGPNQ